MAEVSILALHSVSPCVVGEDARQRHFAPIDGAWAEANGGRKSFSVEYVPSPSDPPKVFGYGYAKNTIDSPENMTKIRAFYEQDPITLDFFLITMYPDK